MKELYYFGCMGRAGHYAHSGILKDGRHVLSPEFEAAFGRGGAKLDTPFCPPKGTATQKYKETVDEPWRVVSWWDNSIDHRGGSHSTFVGSGYDSAEELLADARSKFQDVFTRQPKPTPL